MAGTDSRFNAQQFRDAISFAMTMGLPEDLDKRATFHFPRVKVWPVGAALDQDGNPFDTSLTPTVTQPDPVNVPCAVEFRRAEPMELPVGQMVNTVVTVTLLDRDYEIVKAAREVVIDGDTYIVRYEEPPLGLFEVTVHRIVCFAKDET